MGTAPGHRLRRALALTAALAALAALPAWAGPGTPETRLLPNGLKVTYLEDHALPLVSVSLWVGSGSKFETESSAGYAHFLEHLIQRGTATRGPFEYTRLAHRWGGSLSVRSNYDRTAITLTGVPAALDDMLDAAAQMAFHATLKDTEIDLELGSLTQEIRTYYDLPSSVAFLETMRAAFPDHPYRHPTLGNFASIGKLRSDALGAFYRNLYVPNNMALAVAGDFGTKEAAAHVQAVFGSAPRSATLPPPPAPPAGLGGHGEVEKRLDIKENWTTLAFVGPGYRHPDRPAFEVLATALAGPASPLSRAVASAGAGTVSQVSYYGLEDAGILYVALTPSTPELSYTAAAAALGALAAVRKDGFPEAEVRGLTGRLVRNLRLRAASTEERAERLGEADLFGGARYYWDAPDRLSGLTPADLARVAARYLVSDNLRCVVLVPKTTGSLPEASKDAFHKAVAALGAAPEGASLDLQRTLYPAGKADGADPKAWGDASSAAGLGAPARARLKNGLTSVVLEDHRHGLAAVSLQIRAGSGLDPQGREGLAGLALRILGARTAAGMASRIPGAAEIPSLRPEAQVQRDLLEIRFVGTPDEIEPGLAALAEALTRPLPGEAADLETARRSAIQSLTRASHSPDAIALDLFHDKVYGGDPYAHPPDGTRAGLDAVTSDDLAAFAARALTPDRTVVSVAGDVDAHDTARAIERAFGAWRAAKEEDRTEPESPGAGRGDDASAAPSAAKEASPATSGARPGEYSRQSGGGPSRVLVGVATVPLLNADFHDLRLLGAAVTLQGFEDMVFTRRAAFAITAIPEGHRRGGALAFQVLAQPARRGGAQFDIQRLLRKMAAEDLPAADRLDLGRMLAGREAAAAQGDLALASLLAFREASGLGAASWRDGFDTRPPEAGRLKSLAQRYLAPERWITVVVTPPSS